MLRIGSHYVPGILTSCHLALSRAPPQLPMDVMSRVVVLGLFTVASARQHAMRGIDSAPTREEFLAVLAENKVLREEIAALRAGRGGGGRALKFAYHAVEGESHTMETCMEDFELISAPTSAPTSVPAPKPTGAAGDHSSFTETRDCAASCSDCDEVDFTPYLDNPAAIEPDMFSDRSNCVCVIMHDADMKYRFDGDYIGENQLNLTPYDDCVSAQGVFGGMYAWFRLKSGDGDDVMVLSDAEDIYVDGEGGDDTITCLAGADCDRIKDYY